jgi:hypothetical protein
MAMRTLVKITIPVQPGNKGITDGSLPRVVQNALETLKPEAAYFITDNGHRCALMVIDLQDSAQVPAIAEPFFMALDARVEFFPAMNAQDLQRGLAALKL